MQGEQEISITLEQLYKIDNKTQQRVRSDVFAVYLSANSGKTQTEKFQQFVAKDTGRIPLIPIRRTGCQRCIKENIKCQNCEDCIIKGKICCRNINCVYEFNMYMKHIETQIYQKCSCMDSFQPSSREFEIDWRLMELLQKLKETQFTKYNYYIHYKAGILSISEQVIVHEEEEVIINRLIFQNSYFSTPDNQMGRQLVDQNMRNLKGLFKQNIKTYISYWEDWDESNIYESCHQIIEKCLKSKTLEQFRQKLQKESKTLDNQFTSGRSIKSSPSFINITNSWVKRDENMFRDLSRAINRNILFFYHCKLRKLVVANAKYEEKEVDEGIKVYSVILQSESESLQKAVWFKDRKGDIFAIDNESISIFKYHLLLKKMKQIVLRRDKNLSKIKRASQILYIPQSDRVYYFDASNLGLSYYFQLYRPYTNQQKEFSNCQSINSLNPLSCKRNIKSQTPFYRSTFIMEDLVVQQDHTKAKQLLPVIYLFAYINKNSTDPFSVYRMTFVKKEMFLEEYKSVIKNLQLKPGSLDYQNGLFTMVKLDKCPTLCFQGQINGTQILITGKLTSIQYSQSIQWSMSPLLIENYGFNVNRKKEFQKQFQKSEGQKQSYFLQTDFSMANFQGKQKDRNGLLINDIVGVQANNYSKYLGFLPNSNRFVQIILCTTEGDYAWHLHNYI